MIKEEQNRPICQKCNEHPCKYTGKSKLGFRKYKKLCSTCNDAMYNHKTNDGRFAGYRLYKKSTCELCGFIPVNRCQLDVDHIDGDKHNNDVSNLQTLCANCHRLKTYKQKRGLA